MEKVRKAKTHLGLPYIWTPTDKQTQAAIKQQRSKSPPPKPHADRPWDVYLSSHPQHDFLGDLLASGVINPDQEWSRRPEDEEGALAFVNEDIQLFRTCRNRLKESLHEGLLRLIPNGISKHGGFLYYTDRLDKCLVYDYRIPHASQKVAKLRALVDIPEPDFLYDIGTAIANAAEDVRSALKNALVYGHKIVAHRNTFVHVDRRRDEGTAGPFIDTLILNEMLHKYVYEHFSAPELAGRFPKVMEIGTGSGMLIAACFQNLPGIRRLVALDTSMEAIHCAYRNVLANHPAEAKDRPSEYFVCGLFQPTTWENYDLVMCNPPYVPINPDSQQKPGSISNIAGTDLMMLALKDVPSLLSNQGFLFMVYSSLADAEFKQAVAEAQIEYDLLGPPDGFEVRFDLDEVFADKDWLSYLIDKRGLKDRKQEIFHHTLRCVALHKSAAQGFADNSGLLARIKELGRAFSNAKGTF